MYNANIYLVKWKEGKLTRGNWLKIVQHKKVLQFWGTVNTATTFLGKHFMRNKHNAAFFDILGCLDCEVFCLMGIRGEGWYNKYKWYLLQQQCFPLYIVTQMGEIFSTTLDLSVLWRRSGSSPATSRPGCWSHCPWLLPSPLWEGAGWHSYCWVRWLATTACVERWTALSGVRRVSHHPPDLIFFIFLHKEHSHFFLQFLCWNANLFP